MARAAVKGSRATQSCPDNHWQSGGRWIGKTLRLSGMNAPGYDSAGEGMDQIVSGHSLGGASVSASGQPASQLFSARKISQAGGPTFDFFRLC